MRSHWFGVRRLLKVGSDSPLSWGSNGRIKKGAVTVDGKERQLPSTDYFEVRYLRASTRRSISSVGTETTEAVNERDRHAESRRRRRHICGSWLESPSMSLPTRKDYQGGGWLGSRRLRRTVTQMEAAKVNASALLEFQQANPKLAIRG